MNNNMKKYLILAAAAMVALAACSKVEADINALPDVKIGYQVASYAAQTKADDGGFLKEMEAYGIASTAALFKSVAYINADNGNGGVAAPARFYYGATDEVETITYTAASGSTAATWEPAHTYYWPKSPNSSLDFFSWYDYSETASSHVANATFASDTYTLAWTADRTVALKDNVMYADPVWNQKQNRNPGQYKKDGVAEGVPTLFHHALAQVRFQFKQKTMSKLDKDGTNSTFWVVTVKNLTIPASTLKKNGTLSLTAAKDAASWTTPTNLIWAAAATPAYWATADVFDADPVGSTGKELTSEAVTFSKTGQMPNDYITVLPQEIGNAFLLNFDVKIDTYFGATLAAAKTAGVKASETIHIKDFPSQGALVKNSGIQLNLMTAIGKYWQMNKKYTYLFEIDPETATILYDPAVEDWAADVQASQTIPASN